EKELETNKRLVDEWQRKAEQAVEMDRDDLARKALTRKREYGNLVGSLEQQYEAGQGTADGLRQTLRGLEAKLADAKRRKATLIARKRTAEAEIAAENHLARAGRGAKAATSFAKFEHFEEQVDDLEAEAGAL
ncbi:MAG: hypothetical protein GTN78_01505, partial [Gemmatimonadales bacterium]|nr:hypothetical protein [Gemmatimonadales bacterium]